MKRGDVLFGDLRLSRRVHDTLLMSMRARKDTLKDILQLIPKLDGLDTSQKVALSKIAREAAQSGGRVSPAMRHTWGRWITRLSIQAKRNRQVKDASIGFAMAAPTIHAGIASQRPQLRLQKLRNNRLNRFEVGQMRIISRQALKLQQRQPHLTNVERTSPARLNRKFVADTKARTGWKPGQTEPHPPHDAKRLAYTATYTPRRNVEYVRVFLDRKRPAGGWLMRKSDYEKIARLPNPGRALKELYSLKDVPKYVVDFVPSGPVRLSIGIANKHPKLGKGGGLQFNILDAMDERNFREIRLIRRTR